MLDNTEERLAVLDKFPKLKTLHTAAVGYAYDKRDFDNHRPVFIDAEDHVTVAPKHRLEGFELNPDDAEAAGTKRTNHPFDMPFLNYTLTDHAWSQLGGRLGPILFGSGKARSIPNPWMVASAGHKDSAVRGAFAGYMNTLVANYPKPWLIRTYKDQCRAILTNRYAIIDNVELLRIAAKSLDIQTTSMNLEQVEFGYTRMNPDWLVLDAILKGINPNDLDDPGGELGDIMGGNPYGLGVRIKNNEIGSGSLSVATLLKRSSCNNSIVIADTAYKARHIGLRTALLNDVTVAIGQAMMLGVEAMSQFMKARTLAIPNFHFRVDELIKEMGWSTETGHALRSGTEGQETMYGMINGISAAAQTIENPETRESAEELAGSLLVNPVKTFGRRDWAVAGMPQGDR